MPFGIFGRKSSSSSNPKYRALFIRHKSGTPLVDWIHRLEDEIVTVLKQDFDLITIDEDFDYGEICDKHNPDLVIFDSPGGYRSVPLTIKNSGARPEIPRIGFTNQDPHDTARVAFLNLMDSLKIDKFFTFWGPAAMRQSPELLGKVFTAPLFFDAELYKDYELKKDIPVSVFGWGVGPDFYRWRTAIVPQIYNYFPTLVYTHPGYTPGTERYHYSVVGVDYAKMLNRSHFGLADTTCLDYLVRKHLEIPASGAVVVTPATSDVFYYGFRDLENCIMGSGTEVLQKIAHIASNPDKYEAIRQKGQALASRYSRDKWHYIRDWYECRRSLKPGQTIQQQGIFGPFTAVEGGAETPAVACGPFMDSEFSLNMKNAWQQILSGGPLEEAEAMLMGMSKWMGHFNEPYMLLGVIALLRGQLAQAKEFFLRPYQIRFSRERGNTCLDPEEIAWLSFTGVLMGSRDFVQQTREAGNAMRHLGLRRMDWLFASQGLLNEDPPEGVLVRKDDDHVSIHWTGQLDITNWIPLMQRIMAANR